MNTVPMIDDPGDAAAVIHYSRGQDKYDAYPEQRTAASFEALAEAMLSDRSTAKGLTWISGPFARNGAGQHHRCRDGALPRRFLAFDLDGAAPDAFAELCMLLGAYSGFGYTTASHTAENPHARYMLELSRPVDRAEGIRLGAAMQWQIETRLGLGALKFDDSVYRGEQPIYGPLVNADVMYYGGNPIDVDAVLATAPEEPLRERPASPDPYEALIIERRLFLHEIDPSKAAIICPFEKDHSERTSDSSTVYFRPLHNGYRWGRIHCSHTHCEGRHQEDYIRGLGAEPRDVWREQAREEPRVGEEPGEGEMAGMGSLHRHLRARGMAQGRVKLKGGRGL